MGKWLIQGGVIQPAPGEVVFPADIEAMLRAVSPERRVSFLETWGWLGMITVTARGTDGRYRSRETFHNIITTAGKNMIRSVLSGSTTDGAIRYLAMGNGTNAAQITDTALQSEQFRKAVTAFNPSGLTDAQNVTRTVVAASEATAFTTEELGWFASPTATATANSGILIARVLYHRAKSPTESLQVDRTDTYS